MTKTKEELDYMNVILLLGHILKCMQRIEDRLGLEPIEPPVKVTP